MPKTMAASTSTTPPTPYPTCGRESSLHLNHTTHPLPYMWTREQPPLRPHHPPLTLHVDERAASTLSTPPTHPPLTLHVDERAASTSTTPPTAYPTCGRESSLHSKHTTHPPLHYKWTREQPPL